MMENLAWALNLLVIAFFLGVVPLLPKQKTWARSLVVATVLVIWARYIIWRITATAPPDLGSGAGCFYLFALVMECLMCISLVIFLVTLSRTTNRSPDADRYEAWLRASPLERLPWVDVFLPTYDEGRELVDRGIVAAKALDYPKFRIWVLDDGRRDWLKDLCAERQVGYIRRPDNKHAKAGNINHALKVTNGELFVVFDADFTAHRNFLYRTVGFFFADPTVAIVQTPQHFFNPDVFQINLGLSEVIQDNEREWYDEILSSRDAWGTAFCCGTSAVFRRDAIESIGGIATETVTEDIHTSLKLLNKGYVTQYLNERLSLGLAPENAKSLLIQRRRWARGHIQLLFIMARELASKLTFRQWVFFSPLHYFIDLPCRVLFAMLPLIYLWTGWSHFYVASTAELLAYLGPAMLSLFFLIRWLIPHARVPLLTSATSFYLSARIYPTVLQCAIKPFGAPFRVTPKGRDNNKTAGDTTAKWELAVIIILTVGGIIAGCRSPGNFYSQTGLLIATGWALCNLVLFGLTLLCVSQRPRLRGEDRFPIGRSGSVSVMGHVKDCNVVDLSLSGALLGDGADLKLGDSVKLSLDGLEALPATVVRKSGDKAGIRFAELPKADKDRLIVYLYTSGFHNHVQEMRPIRVLGQLLTKIVLDPA
jgi:cellulose synthase (UDP-forming)